jgi:excisionase family DNA binding protein
MRGFGDFQRAQMKRSDPRIAELFRHVRDAIDILERLALDSAPVAPPPELPKPPKPPKLKLPSVEPTPITIDHTKITYSIKEVSQKIGVSRSYIYEAMANKQLRAVKCGKRTQILTSDLQAWVASWPARG